MAFSAEQGSGNILIPYEPDLAERLLDAPVDISSDSRDFLGADSLSRAYVCIADGLQAGQIVFLEPPVPSGNFPLPLGDRSVIAHQKPGEARRVHYRVFKDQLPELLTTIFSGQIEDCAAALEALYGGSTLVFEPAPAFRPETT